MSLFIIVLLHNEFSWKPIGSLFFWLNHSRCLVWRKVLNFCRLFEFCHHQSSGCYTLSKKVKSKNHCTRAYDGSSEVFWCTECNAKNHDFWKFDNSFCFPPVFSSLNPNLVQNSIFLLTGKFWYTDNFWWKIDFLAEITVFW